jgi:hypothetical protein
MWQNIAGVHRCVLHFSLHTNKEIISCKLLGCYHEYQQAYVLQTEDFE